MKVLDDETRQFWNHILALVLFTALLVYVITASFQARRHYTFWHPALLMIAFTFVACKIINIYQDLDNFVNTEEVSKLCYSFLLPPIVLAEGWFWSQNTYKKAECVKLTAIAGLFTSSTFTVGLIYGLDYLIQHLGFKPPFEFSMTVILVLTICLNTSDFHGALAPLHAMKNSRMENTISSGVIWNNNLSLIFVMVWERYLADHSLKHVGLNLIKIGILSVLLGLVAGGLYCMLLKKVRFITENPNQNIM